MTTTEVTLIIATLGRVAPLARLLDSLVTQTAAPHQVILVDQNTDGRLDGIEAGYAGRLPLQRIHGHPGLSRARNVGLAQATGSVIGFPDDDAWYPPGVLADVSGLLSRHTGWDGITGSALGDDGAPLGRWDPAPGAVTRDNVWTRGISFTIFLRRQLVDRVGPFDERLGLGAGTPWGSGEETDYLLRAIHLGAHIRYEPGIRVGHPSPRVRFDAAERARGASYGRGFGRVLRTHGYPPAQVARHLGRPAAGAILAIARGRVGEARYRAAVATGRLRGWRTAIQPGGDPPARR